LLASLPASSVERVGEFLGSLRACLQESKELQAFLLDPAVPRTRRTELLRNLAGQHDLPPQVGNLLETVVHHNRTSSLASIARVFQELHEESQGIVEAEIATAVPLTEDLEQKTRATLERMTGGRVRLTARVDPRLLGGAVTRIGSRIWDGSLRTQLEQLGRKMGRE
jgi:F-type H+-transporting ATPase subunit delta